MNCATTRYAAFSLSLANDISLRADEATPNILVILVDDLGY